MLPQVQSSFDSPPSRKVQRSEYSVVPQVTLQEGAERLELTIKKQQVVFRSRRPKALYLLVKSIGGEAQKKVKS